MNVIQLISQLRRELAGIEAAIREAEHGAVLAAGGRHSGELDRLVAKTEAAVQAARRQSRLRTLPLPS